MEDSKSNKEEFVDALDDFPFLDCEETFPEPIESDAVVSSSNSNPKLSPEGKILPPAGLRRRNSPAHRKPDGSDPMDSSKFRSLENLESYLNYREKKRPPRKIKEYDKKSADSEKSDSIEIKSSSIRANDNERGESIEKNEEHSTITDANNDRVEELVRNNGSNFREDRDANSNLLVDLAGILIKAISFQFDLLTKLFMFPLWIIYYGYMLVFNPFGLLLGGRGFFVQKVKRIWSILCENVSPHVYEWLNDHKSIWKLGLKCGWGLLWSGYVCFLLSGLLVSAFVMGGLIIRGVVEEPMRVQKSLNFDYSEKSPVAFVPLKSDLDSDHDVYFGEKPEIGKSSSGLRIIPTNHKLQASLLLTLPESDYNRNLGIFQVKLDFISADGKTLSSSRRPCMLHFKSHPIRLLLTFLKVAPILTGYTSETQNLKIYFKGYTESNVPTAYLRVILEQRAEFMPGAGIPEIYAASLTLESELPLLKRVMWFWRKTLFVWISMTIFTVELFFALLCCKPIFIPRIRLREVPNNGLASQNDNRVQS